jgi:hypothetical protein
MATTPTAHSKKLMSVILIDPGQAHIPRSRPLLDFSACQCHRHKISKLIRSASEDRTLHARNLHRMIVVVRRALAG